jgi:hypothetical protein
MIVTDDIGRPSIARDDAKRLFDEQRERDASRAAVLAAADQQAAEYDREWRKRLRGIPADMIPAGMAPAAAMVAAELDSHAYLPRRASVAEDLRDNSRGLTFHPIHSTPDES